MTRLRTYIGANIAWLLLLPGSIWYYCFRLERGDYPIFADSIGIPLLAQLTVFLFLLAPLNLFLFLTMMGRRPTTRLFIRAGTYSLPAVLWELLFGFLLLINLLCCLAAIIGGDHISIPVVLYFILILLNLRAGRIRRYHSKRKLETINSKYLQMQRL